MGAAFSLRGPFDLRLKRLSHCAHLQYPPHRVRSRLRVQRGKRSLSLGGRQAINPFVIHQSVRSIMLSENVPASLLIAETRWPGLTLTTSMKLAGKSAAVVEEIAGVCGSTIAKRKPQVFETYLVHSSSSALAWAKSNIETTAGTAIELRAEKELRNDNDRSSMHCLQQKQSPCTSV